MLWDPTGLVSSLCPAVQQQSLVHMRTEAAELVLSRAGGCFSALRLSGTDINPLAWGVPGTLEKPEPCGHFLCLDRWGPPSDAEGRLGMPYHGEASHTVWSVESMRNNPNGVIVQMSAELPLAGLAVRRTVALSAGSAVYSVSEEVLNSNRLGRMLNMVQHPTIAPPFLEPGTRVDCNGTRGLMQDSPLPNPERLEVRWPFAMHKGRRVDLRRLHEDHSPNVVSFVVPHRFGWITAASPAYGLLLGYVWPARDYPWVSVWRHAEGGAPAARGLEFGTTGLHQPYKLLAEKGRIFDRPLFVYLDAGERMTRRYAGFLLRVPKGYGGTEAVQVHPHGIDVVERGGRLAGRLNGGLPEGML
jgi:hypothetical protein